MTVKSLSVSGNSAKKKAEFFIHVPLDGVTLQPGDEGKSRLNFDVAAAAFVDKSKDGQPAGGSSKTVSAALTDPQMTSMRANGIGMNDAIELGPGQYTVRIVIRDNVTGKVGSVTAPLTVN
jgi:hypothetical protein